MYVWSNPSSYYLLPVYRYIQRINRFEQCRFWGNSVALTLNGGYYLEVRNNVIEGNGIGIALSGSQSSTFTISDNAICGNRQLNVQYTGTTNFLQMQGNWFGTNDTYLARGWIEDAYQVGGRGILVIDNPLPDHPDPVESLGGFACTAPPVRPGFTLGLCKPSPCVNGGVCVDLLSSFRCSCPLPFSGTLCESKYASHMTELISCLQKLALTTAQIAIRTEPVCPQVVHPDFTRRLRHYAKVADIHSFSIDFRSLSDVIVACGAQSGCLNSSATLCVGSSFVCISAQVGLFVDTTGLVKSKYP
jgi:hypothetical protein